MEIPYTSKERPDTGLWNAKMGIWLFLASEVMLFGALFSTYILLRTGAPETGFLKWPLGSDFLNIPIGTFNTFVLITSSITMVMAWASLKMKEFKKFKIYQGLTLLCGLFFLLVKTYEYNEKFNHYGVWLNDGKVVLGHHLKVLPQDDKNWTHLTIDAELKGEEAKHGHAHEERTYQRKDVYRHSNFTPKYSPYFSIYFTLTGLHALHVIGGMIMMAFLFGRATCTIFTGLVLGGIYFLCYNPLSKMLFDPVNPEKSLFLRFGSWVIIIGLPVFCLIILFNIWKNYNSDHMMHHDPERFTNRVETAGLFWHFVDLVWIFLFPVLYLL